MIVAMLLAHMHNTSHAGTDYNGTDYNGTDYNGTDYNGTDYNGTDYNGTDYNGTDYNGTDYNGTDYNGTDYNGTDYNGTSPISMSGSGFVGIQNGVHGSPFTVIKVTTFRGGRLDGLTWSKPFGWNVTELRPRDLLGVQWVESICRHGLCQPRTYRIVDVEIDRSVNTMPAHDSNLDVWLYNVEFTDEQYPTEKDWRPACTGDARGIFITGQWFQDGSRSDTGYTFSCTSGVIAKCVRIWGYKPWKTLQAYNGKRAVNLRTLHQACTRAVRADYCGNGTSYTRDGTLIDVFDKFGFNVPERGRGLTREAGFSAHGAVWIARTRWPVSARVGIFKTARPQCTRSHQTTVEADTSALIYVRSRPFAP